VLKLHTVTLHHNNTICNDMFNYMDGIMQALDQNKTQSKEDIYFSVKCAQLKLSKYHAEITPMTGMILITAHIIDPSGKLRSFRNWDEAMDISPQHVSSYTTLYQVTFLEYVENEYCAKHTRLVVIKPVKGLSNNHFPSPKAPGCGQSSSDQYDLSSNDEEYLTLNHVAETTTAYSDHLAP